MSLKLKKGFYCTKCKKRQSQCFKEDGLCVDFIEFVRRNEKIKYLKNQDNGQMTVSECIMLHGRLATLKILGEKEMAAKLELIEPKVEWYRNFWEKNGIVDGAITDWIDQQNETEKKEIIEFFEFYTKEVGLFLSSKNDEII